jgi:phosphoribosylpyrophosphate synthetase
VSEHGAKQVWAIVTHGILSGKAIETINSSCLSGLVVTNSKRFCNPIGREERTNHFLSFLSCST